MTETEIKKYLSSRINKLRTPKNGLKDLMNYFWNIIKSNSTDFDLSSREIEQLQSIGKEEILQFFKNTFKNCRKLSIQLYSQSEILSIKEPTTSAQLTFSGTEQKIIDNITAFTSGPRYPYVEQRLPIN